MTKARQSADFAAGGFFAGKNAIINGDFGVWQRGTSITGTGTETFSADRFLWIGDGSGGTRTFSRQTMGYGDISGYQYPYFFRFNQSVAGSGASYNYLCQRIESATTFAGQTVTFSFWAKAGASTTLPAIYARQRFGSGGSAETSTTVASNIALTTSWQRFSYSFTVPSIAGKTVGTGSYLTMDLYHPINTTFTIDTFGWQLEQGSVATPFETATGTIQGELAACQRYYWRIQGKSTKVDLAMMMCRAAGTAYGLLQFPVSMRTSPTMSCSNVVASAAFQTSLAGNDYTADQLQFFPAGFENGNMINALGVSGATAGWAGFFSILAGKTTSFIEASAEL